VHRTRLLRSGASLTDAVATTATSLAITARILPATDDRLRTRVQTDAGELDFQEYFVRLRQQPEVTAIRLDGLADARPTPDVLAAIADADLLVIGPSNPLVSIGPILELSGMREAMVAAAAPKVAVSPIVAGRALKGPADRMLASMGHEATALGVARLYAGLVDRFVIDTADDGLRADIEALGMAVEVLPTVMRTDDDRRALASALLPEG
jgi:LPPG:FO 2-phospho-L-lactate transferase